MSCIYFKREHHATTLIGRDNSTESLNNCMLKKESEEKQMEVFSALAKKGLERSFVSDNCPFAEEGNFDECPFYKNY